MGNPEKLDCPMVNGWIKVGIYGELLREMSQERVLR